MRKQRGYFGSAPCFGMLDLPAKAPTHGVVIVNDFGYRGLCIYWTLRRLAQRLVDQGHAVVLRFDLPGVGDSPETRGNRVDYWETATSEAIDFLRRGGIERIGLVGFGFGALLAFNAAARHGRVSVMELVNPFVSGERYLAAIEPTPPQAREGGRVLGSLFLSEGEEAAMRRLSMADVAPGRLSHAHVVSFGDDDAFAYRERLGGASSLERSEAAKTFLLDPECNQIPDFFDGIVQRMRVCSGHSGSVVVSLVRTHRDEHAGYVEEAVSCPTEAGQALEGVLAIPVTGDPLAAVLVFGTAANPRCGVHGNDTYWSRALAASGVATLRFDASGFGDSDPRDGFRDNETFSERNFTDAIPVTAFLRSRGFVDFGGFGLSSGGFHAFASSLNDPSFIALFGVNTARFRSQSRDEVARENLGSTGTYVTALGDPRTWGRLLRGQIDVRRIASVLLKRFRQRNLALLGVLSARLRREQPTDLGTGYRDMMTLLKRPRSRVELVFCDGDPWLPQFEREFAPRGAALSGFPNVRVTFIQGGDHTLSSPGDREKIKKLAVSFFWGALGTNHQAAD